MGSHCVNKVVYKIVKIIKYYRNLHIVIKTGVYMCTKQNGMSRNVILKVFIVEVLREPHLGTSVVVVR
jgi:hypothetical protein